ncbi:MAG TPA: Gfo/Idh/MocA family oxidoreductase [Acidobacteriaceae bacterium]|nr:Gfo/Idh/MocA family oxidoreductase [Acidobacteriaceae bacterium]
MDSKVGVAFVGAGIVAEMHGRGVSASTSARLIGVYDVNAGKAAAIASRFGGRQYESLEQLLADPEVRGVHVLTPLEDHVSTAVAAMRAGKDVLLEKPVASSRADIRTLQKVAKEQGRICMPAHNYIYVPSLRRAKRLIESGKLGKIASLFVLYNVFHSEEIAAIYGGVLRAVCMHHAYSLLYLLGRPKRVACLTSSVHYERLTCEDQAMITCEMQNGAIANLWCSFAANDPTNDPWTVIYKILGTKGGVSYSWNEAQFQDDGGPAWGLPCYEEGFVEEIDFFVKECIAGGKAPLSTLDDAADALTILEAAQGAADRFSSAEPLFYEDPTA